VKNLTVRLLTAAIAVPLILALLYLCPWWGFASLAGAAMIVAALEFFGMTHAGDRSSQLVGTAITAALFAVLVWTDFGRRSAGLVIVSLVALAPVALVVTLVRPGDVTTSLVRMASLALGPAYVGSSLAAIACIRRLEVPGHHHVGAGLVLLSLMAAWFGDTGGYFAGRGIGGPKLYPTVSPNKTWAGAVGGLAGSGLGAAFAHFVYLPELPLVRGLAVAVVAGALGQIGDLCESLLKRSTGVKDSGGILPGHGGILDRVDALLFVALAVYGAARAGWLGLPL